MTTDTMTRQAGNPEMGLLRRLFPRQIDNNFPGRRLAIWLFALYVLLGLRALVLSLLCLIALVRYRAMIPLLFLMLLVLNISARVVQFVHPIARAGGVQPIGFYVNLFLLAVLIVGFVLSLARSPART